MNVERDGDLQQFTTNEKCRR